MNLWRGQSVKGWKGSCTPPNRGESSLTTRDRLARTMPAVEQREEAVTIHRVGSGQSPAGRITSSLRDLLSGLRINKPLPLRSILPERGPFADHEDNHR